LVLEIEAKLRSKKTYPARQMADLLIKNKDKVTSLMRELAWTAEDTSGGWWSAPNPTVYYYGKRGKGYSM